MGGQVRRLRSRVWRVPWRLWLAGILVLAALAGNGLLFYRNTQTLVDRDRLVTRTQMVLTNLNRTLVLLTDAETGQRGYILTGQARYLQPYRLAVQQIGPQLARLQQATADNPLQQRRLPQLRSLVADKMAELAQTVALCRQGRAARAQQIVLSNRGLDLMDRIRALLAAMTSTALTRLGQRTAQADQAETTTTITLVAATGGGMVLLIALLLAVGLLLRRRSQLVSTQAELLARANVARLEAEAALQLREEVIAATGRFRTMVEEAPVAISIKEADGTYRMVNPAYCALYGYTAEELVGRHHTLVFPEDEQAQMAERHAAHVRQRQRSGGEHAVRTKDGRVLHVLTTSFPLADVDGTPLRVSFTLDITERAREQEARARLAAIVDSSHDAIIGKSLEGIIESWNPGAVRLYGYSATEAIGRHIGMLAPPDRDDEPAQILEQIGRGERIAHRDTVRIRKDGSSVDVSLAIFPIRDWVGRIIGAGTIARDITEQVRARQVAEQAREAAEAAARLREEFLSIAGHELRTPLTSALGNLQLARHWVAGEDLPLGRLAQVRTALQRTERQALRLNRLVQDLLDASRIQADRLELRLARCELAPIVHEVVAEHRLLAPSRTIQLEASSARTMPVLADAERIAQVVTNYLSNALRYSADDQPVTVGLAVEERPTGDVARVWVRDVGPGLAASEHERVWERFYRSRGVSHQSGSSEGLGLGLYICRTIVERHLGQVGVESAPGAGARFWFTLPLAAAEEMGDRADLAGAVVPARSSSEQWQAAYEVRG